MIMKKNEEKNENIYPFSCVSSNRNDETETINNLKYISHWCEMIEQWSGIDALNA